MTTNAKLCSQTKICRLGLTHLCNNWDGHGTATCDYEFCEQLSVKRGKLPCVYWTIAFEGLLAQRIDEPAS